MDRISAEFSYDPDGLRGNVETANGVRPSRVEHAVEDGHANSRFGLLAIETSRSQSRANDGLVTAHRGFNQSALPAVSLFSSTQSSSVCDH